MTLKQVVETIVSFIDKLIIMLVAIAFIAVVYAYIRYFFGGKQSSQDNSQFKSALWSGIIGMFVISSLWGILRFIGAFFNLY